MNRFTRTLWSQHLIHLSKELAQHVRREGDNVYKITNQPAYDDVMQRMDTVVGLARTGAEPFLLSHEEEANYARRYIPQPSASGPRKPREKRDKVIG